MRKIVGYLQMNTLLGVIKRYGGNAVYVIQNGKQLLRIE
jgi:hypothetical protein